MDDSRRSTLNVLISLKMRRERSIRATLASLEEHEAALLARKASFLDERHALWEAWRSRAASDAMHDCASLQDLKLELAGFYHRDRALADQIEAVDAQWQELRLERNGQLTQLRKAQVDQEKLISIME
ncbi:hypothetical protein [Burkholderia ubonensis]|uniref:hypothetical protein n=1 Tax=Burkholderia ubonensis TaxID=101571 RepID=UPI000754E760|nr:hypothetical protein [Burkholderia ubonensis]KWN58209.1 hypothetical protein WM23_17685 [Burkholderia ubonensis]